MTDADNIVRHAEDLLNVSWGPETSWEDEARGVIAALLARVEQAERERDTLREALEAAVALYATPEPECSTDEYARLEKAMQAGLAAVSPPQEGGDGLYIDHSLAVVKFPSPPQEGEA